MSELIHEHSTRVRSAEGNEYQVRVCGTGRKDGTWEGWLEFHPAGPAGEVIRTSQETSQPSRRALVYWASGIEPVYLDGAFIRALRNVAAGKVPRR